MSSKVVRNRYEHKIVEGRGLLACSKNDSGTINAAATKATALEATERLRIARPFVVAKMMMEENWRDA